MMMLSEAARMMDGKLHGSDANFESVSKDSRDIRSGDLYVAIKGERFDGHGFLNQVSAAGAAGALVSTPRDCGLSQIEVDDTLQALGKLAAAWRQQHSVRMIGLTGSNGKTTVKEMCRHVLEEVAGSDQVLATEGNLNNDIGMPMTLLRLREQHQYAVIEMGANHVGEIDYLANIARPDVALLNNAGPAHLEGFGSLDNVASAKAEIFNGLGEDGVAIINLDDKYASMWLELCANRRVLTFSAGNPKADVHCEMTDAVRVHHGGRQAKLKLQVPGKHNLSNAMAATAALIAIGVGFDDIVRALNGFTNIGGRLNMRHLDNGARIIDDSYNANPMSVRAGIDVLCHEQGLRILVLGDMGELGDDAAEQHHEIGEYARQCGVDRLYVCGELSRATADGFGEGAMHFVDPADSVALLSQELDSESIVLVKGSRFMKMEQVVNGLFESQHAAKTPEVN